MNIKTNISIGGDANGQISIGSGITQICNTPDQALTKSTQSLESESVKTILLCTANPTETTKLKLAQEIREIKEALKRSKQRAHFQIETAEALRIRDLRRALLDYEPTIVHFSGHGIAGAGAEGLALENPVGQAHLVGADALAALFAEFRAHLDCVVLNACYSEFQAAAISKCIPTVIGMHRSIKDASATEFALGFYDALFSGRGYAEAHRLGCSGIQLSGTPGFEKPHLFESISLEETGGASKGP